MRLSLIAACLGLLVSPAFAQGQNQGPARPHNVVLFVADGLRPGMVNERTAPTTTALMAKGVRFTNTHSLFPTFTTANASGMATGHHLGDTGDFSNAIYVGFPVSSAGNSVTPFLENDTVLAEVNKHFGDNYLNEEAVLRAARAAGLSTAAIGKLGPVLIFDSTTKRDGSETIVFDDSTGRGGVGLSDEVGKRLAAVNLAVQAPTRGENGMSGNNTKPGTTSASISSSAP